jgi:hypothetical protein
MTTNLAVNTDATPKSGATPVTFTLGGNFSPSGLTEATKMEGMEYFLEIFGRLPRAGPGSHEATQRAYELMSGVPRNWGQVNKA